MISNKKNIQKGGFTGTLFRALELVGRIAGMVLSGLFFIGKNLFAVCPNPDGDPNIPGTCRRGKMWDWHLAFKEKHPKAFKYEFRLLTGPGWRFLIMCIKITLFIAIFCLGGPIVLLGGLIFLYTQVYNQLNKRVDDPERPLTDNSNDT